MSNLSVFPALESIEANAISSRANAAYSCLAGLGLLAGVFVLYSFLQSCRARRRPARLDGALWAFGALQLLLLLLSLHAVAHRPKYLRCSALGCAALSFCVNSASLCSLLLLVLVAYVLTFDPPAHSLPRRPGLCAALVLLTSLLTSVLLSGLRGPRDLQEEGPCVMDPARAGVPYAAARLGLTLLTPYVLQLGLLVGGCVRQWRSKGRFLSGQEEGPVFLAVTLVTFCCQLLYSAALLRAALLQTRAPREHAFLSAAESVLFSGSAASLLLLLLLHRPCRASLQGALRQLRDCCRRPGGRTPPHRNIIAPHLEITDTLQDIEA